MGYKLFGYRVIDAKVTLILEEFHQARLMDDLDNIYGVTEQTLGIDWRELKIGQSMKLLVQHYALGGWRTWVCTLTDEEMVFQRLKHGV